MTKEFTRDLLKYENYDPALKMLMTALTKIAQPDEKQWKNDRIECPPDQDPLDKTKTALDILLKYLNPVLTAKINKVIERIQTGAVQIRQHQALQRRAFILTRSFNGGEFQQLTNAKILFNEALENMDMAKYNVKKSKSTEQIEKRAVVYQQKVELFDEQCNQMIKQLAELPKIKEAHSKEIINFFAYHAQYHRSYSNYFGKSPPESQ